MASQTAAAGAGTVVVVTGCAGFIGSHTAEFLLKRGETVVGIDEVNDYYDVRVKESNVALLERVGADDEATASPAAKVRPPLKASRAQRAIADAEATLAHHKPPVALASLGKTRLR